MIKDFEQLSLNLSQGHPLYDKIVPKNHPRNSDRLVLTGEAIASDEGAAVVAAREDFL